MFYEQPFQRCNSTPRSNKQAPQATKWLGERQRVEMSENVSLLAPRDKQPLLEDKGYRWLAASTTFVKAKLNLPLVVHHNNKPSIGSGAKNLTKTKRRTSQQPPQRDPWCSDAPKHGYREALSESESLCLKDRNGKLKRWRNLGWCLRHTCG